jgi:uncharacterized protein (UPF0264 family)
MTGLLVSVRSAAEARAALAGGADLIDVKEPRRGSLGAADPSVWREVEVEVGVRVPLSAALGELTDEARPDPRLLGPTYGFAKLGLAHGACRPDWQRDWQQAIASLPPSAACVAVIYADWQTCNAPEPQQVICKAAEYDCWGVLIDTFDKSRGDLFSLVSTALLERLVQTARHGRLHVVLAGSLTERSFPAALAFSPDYLAVRGAVCGEFRTGEVIPSRVAKLAALLAEMSSHRRAKFA